MEAASHGARDGGGAQLAGQGRIIIIIGPPSPRNQHPPPTRGGDAARVVERHPPLGFTD
jgi:hypothetical protein